MMNDRYTPYGQIQDPLEIVVDVAEPEPDKYRDTMFVEWCSNQLNDDTAWSRWTFRRTRWFENDELQEVRSDFEFNEVYDLKTPKEMRKIILQTVHRGKCLFCNGRINKKKQSYTTVFSNIFDSGKVPHECHLNCVRAYCNQPVKGPSFWDYVWYVMKMFPFWLIFGLVAYFWIYYLTFGR